MKVDDRKPVRCLSLSTWCQVLGYSKLYRLEKAGGSRNSGEREILR
jgi:hypothetical protein